MGLGRSFVVFGFAIVAVMAAAVALLAMIVQRSVDRVDAESQAEQRKIIANVLTLKQERFHAIVEEFGEYAPLLSPIKKLQGLLDDEGPEMKVEHDVDVILIFDADGGLAAQFVHNDTSSSIVNAHTIRGFVRRQIDSQKDRLPGTSEPVTGGYMVSFGKVYSAAFIAIRPAAEEGSRNNGDEEAASERPLEKPVRYMLWLSDISQAEADLLADDFAFDQLALNGLYLFDEKPGPGSHPLHDDLGKVVAWFTWHPETRGQEVLDEVQQWAPLVGLLALTMLGLCAAFWAVSMSAVTRKSAEAAEALRSSAAKSQFLANMSHELRTPLNAIIGFAEMIRTEMFGPIGNARYRDYIGTIHDSGNHLLAIIDQVLNLAKIESQTRHFSKDNVPIDALIDGVVEMARPGAVQKNLSISASGERGLSAHCDATALRQALINLVGNATKYTDAGGLHIEYRRTREGFVSIAVHDTGIGIAPAHLARLGTPFHQVHDAFVQNRGGVGLGLSITKAIVAGMGGHLDIDSKVGQGTTATIRIPSADGLEQRAA